MPGPRPSPATTLAWRYLRGRGLRSALTTLAVALGVMLVFGLNGITPTLVEAFTRSMMSAAGRIDLTVSSAFHQPIPADVLDTVTRTPGVAAASGEVQQPAPLVRRDRSADPKLARLADVIAECGQRGHEMVESMLSFVRGSRKPSERIELPGLFQAVAMLLKSSMPASVELQMETRGELLAVEANHTELQQVLLNLALNAIQAMPEGGRLSLLAERVAEGGDGQWLRIAVQDEGIGMDEATQARLFSPFFTTKDSGTGLGLLSCQRIVESLGGEIRVRSTPGEGTCFELLLPPYRDESEAEAAEVAALPSGSGQRILVVDDEALRLSLLGNALSDQGYQVHLAIDGAAAMRHLHEAGMPELVLVDGGIRLLSASHLLVEMRDAGYDGPAIVLDAPASSEPLPSGMRVHAVVEPLEMRRLFQVVADALARK